MPEENENAKSPIISLKIILTAVCFGIVALAIVMGGLHLPIPGANVVTDPREIFTTMGAALSGPIGGVIIGIFAGIAEPGGIALASLLAHIAGGLWMGFAYKKLVYSKLEMPKMILGWAGLVLAYYYIFVLTGFAVGLIAFYGDTTSFVQLYMTLAKGATVEAILATIITSMALFALPRKNIKPLW